MDKTWHPYIDYPSLETNELFEEFTLDRMSLFPAYDNFLSWLFGTRMESTTLGYTSEIINFSKIPIWSIFCRAGIYSWLLIYLLFYISKKRKAHHDTIFPTWHCSQHFLKSCYYVQICCAVDFFCAIARAAVICSGAKSRNDG